MNVFDHLWQQYTAQNTQPLAIHDLFVHQGESIINDHIALRTIDDPRVNIDVLAKPFEALGYQAKGQYHFKEKKLLAKHYELLDPHAPKVFISQLLTRNFSRQLQSIFIECIDRIPVFVLDSESL